MKPDATQEQEEAVIAALRARLEQSGSARFEFERPTYFTFRTPIEIEIFGDDLVGGSPERRGGARCNRRHRRPGGRPLELGAGQSGAAGQFSREQLASLGLDLFQVASTIRNKVQGEVATRFMQGDREIDILVRSVELGAASVEDVRDMIVGQKEGRPIHLKSVATVELAMGPSEIRRIGQKRAAVVSGNLHGRDMGAVAADVRAAMAGLVASAGRRRGAERAGGGDAEVDAIAAPRDCDSRSSWSTW